jgi:gag-polypeptide of LTR copia-type
MHNTTQLCKQSSDKNHSGTCLGQRRAHHLKLRRRKILQRNLLPPQSLSFNPLWRKATAIIINGIGDKPLAVVAGYMSDPKLMHQKLREQYASSNLSTRMSLMAELQALRYKSGDMSDYLDRYAALLDRLEPMDSKVPPELAIIMFMHSMKGKYDTTIAALRTLGDEK